MQTTGEAHKTHTARQNFAIVPCPLIGARPLLKKYTAPAKVRPLPTKLFRRPGSVFCDSKSKRWGNGTRGFDRARRSSGHCRRACFQESSPRSDVARRRSTSPFWNSSSSSSLVTVMDRLARRTGMARPPSSIRRMPLPPRGRSSPPIRRTWMPGRWRDASCDPPGKKEQALQPWSRVLAPELENREALLSDQHRISGENALCYLDKLAEKEPDAPQLLWYRGLAPPSAWGARERPGTCGLSRRRCCRLKAKVSDWCGRHLRKQDRDIG